jgi:hypothetical protein
MLREVMDLLKPEEGGIYVDATVGPGGHSEELLRHIGRGRLICIDRDSEALELAKKRLNDNRCIFKKARFSEVQMVIDELKTGPVDGVLFDIGLSMVQMKSQERGFSFNSDAPLDMRMDRDISLTADEVVNLGSEVLKRNSQVNSGCKEKNTDKDLQATCRHCEPNSEAKRENASCYKDLSGPEDCCERGTRRDPKGSRCGTFGAEKTRRKSGCHLVSFSRGSVGKEFHEGRGPRGRAQGYYEKAGCAGAYRTPVKHLGQERKTQGGGGDMIYRRKALYPLSTG